MLHPLLQREHMVIGSVGPVVAPGCPLGREVWNMVAPRCPLRVDPVPGVPLEPGDDFF